MTAIDATTSLNGSPARPAAADLRERPLVLLVDDQVANLQAVYRAIGQDHRVLAATGGEQALLLAAQRCPDLVLLDVAMPGMDGFEVCRRLKADPLTRDIAVVFLTGHGDEDIEDRALAAGAIDFIVKPIRPRIVRARIAAHLRLKREGDRLRSWVYVDALTGVRNRRCFDERLQQEWGRAWRHGTPLALLIVDIDLFKACNDVHGHAAGDECLREVARRLGGALHRPGDLLARFGGEEFACLLPQTDLRGALVVAERLRQSVRSSPMPIAAAPTITVSVGVAVAPPCADPTRPPPAGAGPRALVQAADAWLYRAKAAGRDRVMGGVLEPPVADAGAPGS